ncbi:M56 family metallopeptidase [Spirilliplanes yamanashiensis]|uniref:Peptidase M48 domain-containing protein n=1 Tax=Spirilliplanes yamanashiensis TaxID=42233 RepID=A0A8J3YDB2_9ACTN|nr:M56 family metallopeptidase [Spirilliplanes yamanashiensis]MDP9818416.1 Zn-dependent protease with chaperone function [Spirilliplanes yamanashiensis]GIJ06636.1 hypothetical protein Sya03_59880 [Spirilliplanes yamanashiensis]
MMAWHLLLFAVVLASVAPRVLGRARWVYRSPKLGIAAWYAMLAGVVSAVLAATAALLVPPHPGAAAVCVAWRWCVQAARGEYGAAGQLAAATMVLVTGALAGRLLVSGVGFVRKQRAHRHRHLQMLRLAGRDAPELGATVVTCAEPAAYMVAGHHRRVVITTGAVATLRDEELAAVLAHERAHAAGRHDILLSGVRVLRAAFPWLPLFHVAADQLGRLVEMRADEVAVANHRPINLARALVAMAGATSPQVPAGALAATGGDAVARLGRLLDPPDRLSIVQRWLIGTGIAAMAAAPALTLAASWLFPSLNVCAVLPL